MTLISRQGARVIAMAGSAPLLKTIPNVEILHTGIEYPLASGPTTFTEDDLADIVASQDDPAVRAPRLKLGHTGSSVLVDSGEPAVGTAQNLRLSENRQTLVGDYVGMPGWLADVLPSAYPSRSVEGNFDVQTVTGKTWRLVIDTIALLGVVHPGCTVLEDVQALYSEEGPDNVTIIVDNDGVPTPTPIAAARSGQGPHPVLAQAGMEDVRRAFYETLNPDQQWYWWVVSVLVDPNELVVEDDADGQLYRVAFTVTGDDANPVITFEDPVPVRMVYVNTEPVTAGASPAQERVALVASAGREVAVFANRSESRPETTRTEASSMNRAQLIQALGLPEDATDEQIQQAVTTAQSQTEPGTPEPATPPAESPPGPGTPGTPGTPATPAQPEPVQEPTPPAAAPPAPAQEQVAAETGLRTIDAETLTNLQRDAALGRQAREEQVSAARTGLLDRAIAEGRIPPARRAHYEQLLQTDPDGTANLLTASAEQGGLAPGTIPLEVRGSSAGDSAAVDQEAYPKSWLPELAPNNNGRQPVTTEA